MKNIISFSVSESEIESLKSLADANGVSLSQVARGFLRRGLYDKSRKGDSRANRIKMQEVVRLGSMRNGSMRNTK